MSEKQVIVQQVDEITISQEHGQIIIEQRDTSGNGDHARLVFPVSYTKQVIEGIKAAAK